MTKEDWELVLGGQPQRLFLRFACGGPLFQGSGQRRLCHTTSTSGLIGNMGQANYSAAKLGVAGLSKSIAIDMQRFNARSNCIAPFAFTRMVGTIPANTEENRARLKREAHDARQDRAAGLRPCQRWCGRRQWPDFRCADERTDPVQPEPPGARTTQTEQGWTPETVLSHALPAMRPSFYPLDISNDVFTWDPF